MGLRRRFRDRIDAGQRLARHLDAYRETSPIILGLPRGGVPVAYEVARALGAPLDVCVVRKVGAPIQPELGIGAVSEEGALHIDRRIMRDVGVSEEELAVLIADKRAEVEERVRKFRRGATELCDQASHELQPGHDDGGVLCQVTSLRSRYATHASRVRIFG